MFLMNSDYNNDGGEWQCHVRQASSTHSKFYYRGERSFVTLIFN